MPTMEMIKWNQVDANCKKKVSEYLYNRALQMFGTVIITTAQFDSMFDTVEDEINEMISDYYESIGIGCDNVDKYDIERFYARNVAAIV